MVDFARICDASATAGSNAAINGISLAEGWAPSTVNNAFRELCSQLQQMTDGTDPQAYSEDAGATAGPDASNHRNSASPADADFIGRYLFQGDDDGGNVTIYAALAAQIDDVTDTTEDGTLLLQTMQAGTLTTVADLSSAAVAITPPLTVADTVTVTGSSAGTLASLISTEAGASAGPDLYLHRNSSSPADADALARIVFAGEDDGDNATEYATIEATADDVTGGTEDGALVLRAMIAGTLTDIIEISSDSVQFKDPADPTKIAKFLMSSITTGNERTFTMGDADATLGGTSDGTVDVSFQAVNSAQDANVTGDGTVVTADYDSETWDLGSDFASDTFTAPSAGKFLLGGSVYYSGVTSSHAECTIELVTSNTTYVHHHFHAYNYAKEGTLVRITWSVLADMDSADTAYVRIMVSGGTKVIDIRETDSIFWGMLVA